MKRILLIIAISWTAINFSAQNNSNTQNNQDKIAELIGNIKKETSVNYYKHISQDEAYKDGLWIESTGGEIWFINYSLGKRDGNMTIYYTSGVRHVDAKYNKGHLYDKVIIYDANGNIFKTYENIIPTDTIVNLKIAMTDGTRKYYARENIKMKYKAFVKKYTSDGIVYKEGYGLFDDDIIFPLYPLGWKTPEDNK